MIKINRFLWDKFGSAENLTTHLKQFADKDKNGNLSVTEFQEFLKDNLKEEIQNRRIQKRDIEGFLSAFNYNKYGATNINKIAPLVFEKDANLLSLTIASKVRANPPPEFVNEELGFVKPAELKGDNVTSKRIRDLLIEIENNCYVSKASTYSIFKAFDVDGDGFVSHKDFEKHLKQQKISATQEEITTLMKAVLDTD